MTNYSLSTFTYPKSSEGILRVLIIDDHRMFNDGLAAMLAQEPGIEVVAQVYDSREAREKVSKLDPHVILMDFNMPHLNGIELTKLLLAERPDLKILMVSMYNDESVIDSFKNSGARGYVFKTTSVKELARAAQKVHAGEYYFRETGEKSTHANDQFLKKLKLSTRELEVIQLIKAGLTTKQIALALNISYYTVETHRKNIKLKAGLKGEADFIKFIYGL
jgi:DNA-binding NarL/FixJ family response regulator